MNDSLKFCSIAYCPPPDGRVKGAKEFYANIRAWRTRYPLILFSEHQWDADTILLKASPDSLGETERRHALSNLIWLTALRILRKTDFTHFMYLESDCRCAGHEWDGKVFDEAFNGTWNTEGFPLQGSLVKVITHEGKESFGRFNADNNWSTRGHQHDLFNTDIAKWRCIPQLAGSVVCHSMCTVSMAWTRRWTNFIADHRNANFSIPCIGGTGIAEYNPPCMFVNGALGIYELKLMLKFFAPQLEDGKTAQAAIEMPAWDVAIGRMMHDTYKEGIFDGRIKHLETIFSGYGEVQSTEMERLEWLRTGRCVACHQVKAAVTGPLTENDLEIPPVKVLPPIERFRGILRKEGDGSDCTTGTTGQIAAPVNTGAAQSVQNTQQNPTTDIFIVTYAKDAEWLYYCLKSIRKFCTGFQHIVVVHPTADKAAFKKHRMEFAPRRGSGFRWRDYKEAVPPLGFLHHMVQVCRADEWCKADFIAHVDSDTVFFKPTTPADYMQDGKPVLLIEPFDVLQTKHPGRAHWKLGVDAALGGDHKFECMCRHPAVHWRGLYPLVRQHIEKVHGKPFDEYVLSCKGDYPQSFSEFCTLGAYAMVSSTMRGGYHFIDVSKEPRPANHLAQGHSHPKGQPNNIDNLHLYEPDFPPEIDTHRKLVEHLGLA